MYTRSFAPEISDIYSCNWVLTFAELSQLGETKVSYSLSSSTNEYQLPRWIVLDVYPFSREPEACADLIVSIGCAIAGLFNVTGTVVRLPSNINVYNVRGAISCYGKVKKCRYPEYFLLAKSMPLLSKKMLRTEEWMWTTPPRKKRSMLTLTTSPNAGRWYYGALKRT
ncbi:uncharacterized protein BT62DRAFT_1012355 [Guyanagaster necrorhizus]|uniref:Uncharacterized protein n=1 Tax=Guyanagaster necrorhizus TaxID=856835 RepID=A0A9P7VIV2_9AGAR|nr:uncharacterized protein BT62DRAFT_1012355 [Guyanagaster necrorhizus MCA 3950]KAG7440759.1 hypothetical protein BT62DRAFT_1012355 [Guyanagaster necrorhizus MCA 3950]